MSTMSTWNPYQILGISKTASDAEIKSAYRRLAKETHPDLHGNDASYTIAFRDITEAYENLSDPEERKKYDLIYSDFGQTAEPQQEYQETYENTQAYAQEPTYSHETYIQKMRTEVAPYRHAALKSLFISLVWFLGGIAVTGISYSLASAGGTYVVAGGAIIFGGWQSIKNFVKFIRLESAIGKYEREIDEYFKQGSSKANQNHIPKRNGICRNCGNFTTVNEYGLCDRCYEDDEDDETHVEFVVDTTDRCLVCGQMREVNENCVCEECFKRVYK